MDTKRIWTCLAILAMVLAVPGIAMATNGDNMISVGPISRSMGGVGIASPQDAVGAVFANPAAMCFGPFCPASQVDGSLTLFKPTVKTKIVKGDGTHTANSEEKVYPIPAVGVSTPLTNESPYWRFGLAAYGVSGMGVDYRDTDVDTLDPFGQRQASGTYVDLQRFKVAPTLAVKLADNLSLGVSLHVNRTTLDLGNGPKEGLAVGVQPGIIYRIFDEFVLGFTYISPQETKHNNVSDFDGDGQMDPLTLEAPQMYGFGLAWEPLALPLVVETDVKWYNWSDAKGYKDFDWKDQWVYNIGLHYHVNPDFTLRAGYNYAESPVKVHDNFNGGKMVSVQGKLMPTYYYETFRIVGFPAIAEQHVTLGLGYRINDTFSLDVSFMHAFENSISESGTDIYGNQASLESTLSESSLGIGLSWAF
ncbi:MAG: OmpP1/FadL family transporter [Thermodesulfobacteriota bacterium]